MERLFCSEIKWNLCISSSIYAKYYFALRSATDKTDVRRNYNIVMKIDAPNAQIISERSQIMSNKQEVLHMALSV